MRMDPVCRIAVTMQACDRMNYPNETLNRRIESGLRTVLRVNVERKDAASVFVVVASRLRLLFAGWHLESVAP